jgi:uncharacterized membrane protein YGL010W
VIIRLFNDPLFNCISYMILNSGVSVWVINWKVSESGHGLF